MELRNLRTLKAISETGSFARAASRLGYTQSTITVHIQQLESDLGVKLFEKSGRSMVLTDKGAEVLEGATLLLDMAERIKQSCLDGDAPTGSLKIASAETVLCYLLGPVMQEFRASAPNVSLKMFEKTCADTPPALIDGSCDLGFTYRQAWDASKFEVKRLCNVPLVPVAAPEHAGLDLTLKGQTIDLPLIVDEPDSEFRRLSENYLEEHNIVYDEAIEMWSVQALKCCVSSGMGFTVLPNFVVQDDIAKGSLVPLRWNPSCDSVPIFSVRKRTHYVTASMRLFSQIAESHLASES